MRRNKLEGLYAAQYGVKLRFSRGVYEEVHALSQMLACLVKKN